MTHQLELPDEVYHKLRKAAETEGVSPADWIDARLPAASSEGRPRRELLAAFIGAFDSSQETPDPRYRSEFGDIIATKLRKQGLNIP